MNESTPTETPLEEWRMFIMLESKSAYVSKEDHVNNKIN